MPKVLFVTTSFENGAIPNILSDLAPHWLEQGLEFEALTLEAIPEEHASVKRWRALGLSLSSLNLKARDTWQAVGPLGRAIHRLKPDLLHSHLGRADIYTAWAKKNIPQVTTFHSVKRNAGRSTVWGWKLTDRRVAHRTGVSQASLDSFYADGFLRSPHSVIYNPVDTARLKPRRTRDQVLASWGWGNDVKLLCAVGRLVPVKGHAELLTAFAQLVHEDASLRLVIAGDGPLQESLNLQISTLGLQGKAVLAGGWDGVGDLYRSSEALVFPSHWEGLGLVPLEALACGCPVVSSRLPAVSEFLEEGVNGNFFTPQDSTSIVQALRGVLENAPAARERAQQGAEMVQERFSPSIIASQYLTLYRKVLLG
ncbi:MAG: glycosyltransferase family 4 protein [Spirochaetales bacterium]|nr:glycosyltransferase family 4 protein [Spirochaetales bacterium]